MRFALIGLGYAAKFLHLPAIQAIPHATIVGGSDPSADARSSVPFPTFASRDELLANIKADIVVVASPPQDHAASCIAALESGAHVLCEKPFVASIAEADLVMDVPGRADGLITRPAPPAR